MRQQRPRDGPETGRPFSGQTAGNPASNGLAYSGAAGFAPAQHRRHDRHGSRRKRSAGVGAGLRGCRAYAAADLGNDPPYLAAPVSILHRLAGQTTHVGDGGDQRVKLIMQRGAHTGSILVAAPCLTSAWTRITATPLSLTTAGQHRLWLARLGSEPVRLRAGADSRGCARAPTPGSDVIAKIVSFLRVGYARAIRPPTPLLHPFRMGRSTRGPSPLPRRLAPSNLSRANTR
jgi:hypothetical protein